MHTRNTIAGFALSFVAGIVLMWGIDKKTNTVTATPDQAGSAASGAQGVGSGNAPPSQMGGTASGAGGVKAFAMPEANEGAVPVELYVMSQCPYGVQAENAFAEIVQKFGENIDFRLEFIGENKGGTLESMHGEAEIMGDIVQACAMKYSPSMWYSLVLCQNRNPKAVALNGESCAKELGIAWDEIGKCASGPEGQELLAASFKKSDDQKIGSSPTIMIAGKSYEGSRRPNDMMRAICAEYKGEKPTVCSEIPESPNVNVTILSDKRCAECDAKQLEAVIRSKIANPTIKIVDYSDEEGKKLFAGFKDKDLPLVIFDKTLDADKDALAELERALVEDNGYRVAVAGEWKPACVDENGCSLEACKNTLGCREEKPKQLDVFVMSQCPFGVKGLDAMREVIENFKKAGDPITFNVHFIGSGDVSALQSMHGQPEVDEDIREICAINKYGKDLKFMDYVWCRNKDIRSASWESCTGGTTGIDTEVMRACSEGDEGKKLLAASFAQAQSVGIGASPTWLANNRYKFSGIDPETIKTNLCAHNKDLKGCENKLSGNAPPPAGGAAAAQPGCGE